MFLRLRPVIYVSALTFAALGCKSSESIPSKGPNAYATSQGPAVVTQRAGESGVDGETSAPLPQSSVKTPADKFDTRSVPAPSAQRAKLDDSEIAAITDVANRAEIEQGRLARTKAKDPRVRDFAAMMVDHHEEAQQDQRKLKVETTANTDSKQMQADAEDALTALMHEKRGKDFDRAYLQLQIDEHRKVLDKIQDELLPSAKNEKLQAYLENIKPKVESHLAQAERLQEELNGTSSLEESAHPKLSNTKPRSSPQLSNDGTR